MVSKNSKSTDVVDWFPVGKAAMYSGLTLDMVNYLCRCGIVKPTGCTKRGRGRVRKYTFSDILLLKIIAKLLANGVSVQRLRKSLVGLQKRGGTAQDILKRKYLATDGKNIYLKDNGVLELLTTGQLTFAFVLELENVRNELAQKITYKRKVASR